MAAISRIYVIGSGSMGMPLAAFLSANNIQVTAVRTSVEGIPPTNESVTVELSAGKSLQANVKMVSLSEIESVDEGFLLLTAKATANSSIADSLKTKFSKLPIVVMQNGIGVEQAYIDAGFPKIYRCVLYATGQTIQKYHYRFREVSESPIGIVKGDTGEAQAIIDQISTPTFRFRYVESIDREAWKKAIINAAFNSICPLINVDNGIFHRDEHVAMIAEAIIDEASSVAAKIGIRFKERELFDQLLLISQRSDGQLISTLQDINNGRETEIEFLNLAIARIGNEMSPPIDARVTRILGEMILAKSKSTI
ncbi:ketopantoate reductase family protein [Sediminispirochaeta bajacaliforniensis]|uniref:ketopantoate reductase family protein n=1 Tax=Sediminispirochaeta bajacaliforniensis TaxID=148 RepID=UPI0003788638|nr:ketopantoate reductase C-terminal domain-containing protein [Sediminispirochaeta bajacaliforniensis]